MANLVIVALPSADDYINKISSQQVAHLTLLFLGDVDQIPTQDQDEITSFVGFAADQMLERFALTVDRRGVLGPDQADVVFFKKSGWCYDDLNSFRSALLQNDDIRDLNNANNQHDEFMPHVTLGYPDTPANPDDRDYPGFYIVNFDRIAVWDQEFAGTEFLLNVDDDYLRMSVGESFVNELLHISEKPWGDFKESDYTLEQWHNACLIHQHDGPPTAKSQCKLPVKTPNGALSRAGVHAALAALHDARTPLKATDAEKAQAATALRGYYKELGENIPDSLAQSGIDEVLDDILVHHGVLGMHWGRRGASTVHPSLAHIHPKTLKEASKDAEEFTRAKLFYGEGAGTRRKLIKATVETKKKRDSHYAKAFDHYVSQTNLHIRANQARRERKRKDTTGYVKKTARGVKQILQGNNQYANTAALVGTAAGTYAYKKGYLSKYISKITKHDDSGKDAVEALLKFHGTKIIAK